jgi:lysophospholipase L1-like esterase
MRLPVRQRCRSVAVAATLTVGLLAAACGGPTPAAATFPSPTATVRPTVVYVALGASDAIGVGAINPNIDGYVPRIIARLPKATSFALNLGVDGILLHDALAQELPQAVAAHPTVMTVWLVGNDFRDCTPLAQYGADLDDLLARLHEGTQAQVFVANTPDMSQLPYFREGAPGAGACFRGAGLAAVRAMAQQWNGVIDPIVAKHGDVLVNLFSSDLASHPDFIADDGFHPSSAGYARLADLFWAQIAAHHAVPGS